MPLSLLAASGCQDGDCPTFWIENQAGDVRVRGYDATDPTGTRELDVLIPAATWVRLVGQLPR